MENQNVMTFGAGKDQHSFVIDEIAAISITQCKDWVKWTTVAASTVVVLLCLKLGWLAAIIAAAVMAIPLKAVFMQNATVVTTGGTNNYQAKWESFSAIIASYLLKSERDNIHIDETTQFKQHMHVINPGRISGYKKSEGDTHQALFGITIMLVVSLFWFGEYSGYIIPAAIVCAVLGYLLWERGLKVEFVGGSSAFFEMSKVKTDRTQEELGSNISSSTGSSSPTTILGINEAIATCGLVLLEIGDAEKDSERLALQMAGLIMILQKTGDEDEVQSKLAYASDFLQGSTNSLEDNFETAAKSIAKTFKIRPKYKDLGNTIVNVLEEICNLEGEANAQQQDLIASLRKHLG